MLRIPGPVDGAGSGARFAVLDHKTNWLGGDEALSAWHYRPAAMAEAMQRAHYPLQALLYTVALHRYLRWRLRGYDPDRNLAGVLYLFLRGMSGADTPTVGGQPCGVFAWRPADSPGARPVRSPRPGPGGGMTGHSAGTRGRGAAFADPCDARLALRAPGLLAPFNAAGVLNAADVHVALRFGRFDR